MKIKNAILIAEIDNIIHIVPSEKKLVNYIKLWKVGYDDKAECINIFDNLEDAKRAKELAYAEDEAARINGEPVIFWRYFITTND